MAENDTKKVGGFIPMNTTGSKTGGFIPMNAPTSILPDPDPIPEKTPGAFGKTMDALGGGITDVGKSYLDLGKEVVGTPKKGFDWLTDKLSDTKFFKEAAAGIDLQKEEGKVNQAERFLNPMASVVGGSDPSNIPLGPGAVIESGREFFEDTERYPDLTYKDWLTGAWKGPTQYVQQVVSMIGSGALEYPNLISGGVYQPEIKFNVPGIGEFSNSDYKIGQRVAAGEDPLVVTLEEKASGFFNAFIITGLMSKVFMPRPVTVGSVKGTPQPKGNLPVPKGTQTTSKPKSFQLYKKPKYTAPLTDDVIQQMAKDVGIDLRNTKYDPSLPSYWILEGTETGQVTAKIMQVKPSYVNTFINKLKGNPNKVTLNQSTTIYETVIDAETAKKLQPVVPKPGTTPPATPPPTAPPIVPPIMKPPTTPPPTAPPVTVPTEPIITPPPAEPPVTPPAEEPLKKITHFTKSENVDKILTEGFDTSLPPVHGVGGLQAGAKVDKLADDVLYFTTDLDRWRTAIVYVGEGKGTIDNRAFDYEKQQWITEKKAYKKVDLSPIEAEIKSDASILVIDSLKKAQTYLGKEIDRDTLVKDLVTKAKQTGVDILNIKNPGGAAWGDLKGDPTKTGFKRLTGGSGKSDYFVLNKDAITVSKPKSKPSKKPAPLDSKKAILTIKPAPKPEKATKEIVDPKTDKIIRKGDAYIKIGKKKAKVPKQLVTKTAVKDLIEAHGGEVIFTYDGQYLTYKDAKSNMKILPSALGILDTNLKKGQTVKITLADLKKTGPALRLKDKNDQVLGFIPKNLRNPFSSKAKAETDKIVRRQEIAKELSDKLGVPMRRGKFRGKNLAGIFKPGPKVIRFKTGGLNTIFHETAHFLDDAFDFSKILTNKEANNLMVEYGKDLSDKPHLQKKEGFAEFVRFTMTGQSDRAKSLAPNFYKKYQKRMEGLPEIKDVLDTAAADFKRWNEQPAQAKILSHIEVGSKKEGPITQRISSKIHSVYTKVKDELHPLGEFSKIANKKTKLPAKDDPYILARNLRGWVGKATTFLEKGTFGAKYWETVNGKLKPVYVGKSFSEILKPIKEAGDLDSLRVYMVSQRAIELARRRITTGVAVADARTAIAELNQSHPHFKDVSEDLLKYQDDLLNYAIENGLVGKEAGAKIKSLNKLRVPFYRVAEEVQTSFMGGKKVTGNLSTPVKHIKGSEAPIIDPLESIVKDTYAIINAVERNNVAVAMAKAAKDNFELGRLFERVPTPLAPTKVNVNDVIEKALVGTDIKVKDLPEELGEEIVTLFRSIQDKGDNMINVSYGGNQYVYQVEPELYNALQGLNAEDISMMIRILRVPASLLRAGATLSPDFMIRNPLRDQFSSFVFSKYGFRPGIDLIRGVFELVNRGDAYQLWKMSGGEHSMLVSIDRTSVQKSFKDVLMSKKALGLKYVKNPVELLRIISELGEAGTRLGEMKRGLDAGADPIEAAFSSREVTLDFGRIGAQAKAMNLITAFFNAKLEGTDRVVRAFKDNPIRSLWKALLSITLPSILLWFANHDDERWKEIPQWQKDLFWIILTDDHIYRIPKPFELGVVFATIPEYILDHLEKEDPDLIKDITALVAEGAIPAFIPTGATPIIENITNHSFFLDRPIVGQGQQDLTPEAQFGTYTSELAKLLGGETHYSPAKIDNLIQGYTAGLGKYATNIMDKVLIDTGIVNPPPKPTIGKEDKPVIKSFMVRPPIGNSSESVNKVYELYGELRGEKEYYDSLLKKGEVEKAEKLYQNNPNLHLEAILDVAITQFANLNALKKTVMDSRTLTPDEKKKQLDQLSTAQTVMAQNILEAYDKAKK